jgi:hypothetical protein
MDDSSLKYTASDINAQQIDVPSSSGNAAPPPSAPAPPPDDPSPRSTQTPTSGDHDRSSMLQVQQAAKGVVINYSSRSCVTLSMHTIYPRSRKKKVISKNIYAQVLVVIRCYVGVIQTIQHYVKRQQPFIMNWASRCRRSNDTSTIAWAIMVCS